tara:strand:+ start:246 stop:401 length:156 start_codon:yes stop_codon:yes gene_type:complete
VKKAAILKIKKINKSKYKICSGKVFVSRALAVKYLSFINRKRGKQKCITDI